MSKSLSAWDPALYERYKSYRDRPAQDLLAQAAAGLEPGQVWDLGSGTGEHAAQMARMWPKAQVHGLDSSPDMLACSRERPETVDWVEGDIEGWRPDAPADLIFTNAALQWLEHHEQLFPSLVEQLAPGGVFACQVPLSYSEPWYDSLRETAADGPWAEKLAAVHGVLPTPRAEDYYRWLSPLCSSLDIWTTRYLHVLHGEDPIVEWMSGTGLRPWLVALTDSDERAAFLDAYRRRTNRIFPRQPDGSTLFPFPRLFMVARRR
jgi:trans-aconitate 2-methyltransferase